MTTTVDTTLGYHGRHGNFSVVKAVDAIVGPTAAHEGISAATVGADNIYNITNGDSGKIIPIILLTADMVLNLPDPSPGVEFTFVVIVDPAFDVAITAQGAQLFGNLDVDDASLSVPGSTSITITDAIITIGDYVRVKGISDTQWFVSGVGEQTGSLVVA